ncbi:translation initiation factor IF-5A [Candidatus Woesearchaeota archaeon]|nr:translation initiation factor IF-5A [Candidatus Woesearchaeota archaeon]
MTTKVVNAGSMKEGSYIIVDGVACKVVSMETSKSGKHGHAKARITAIGLMDEKKREIVLPAHDNVEVPLIDKKTAQVLSVSGDAANVMDAENYETFDLKIPEELKASVVEGAQIIYWNILGEKVMKQLKSKAEE